MGAAKKFVRLPATIRGKTSMFSTTNRPEIAISGPTEGLYRLEANQWIPRSRSDLFAFFADAFQLEILTPPWLHFSVVTPPPITMAEGLLIDYRLRLHGIPLRWQSRISLWEPDVRFVDEQVRGPYSHWHHEHVFSDADQGTHCRDIVHYRVPGGRFIDRFFVRPDLRRIFAFRQKKLQELFDKNLSCQQSNGQ